MISKITFVAIFAVASAQHQSSHGYHSHDGHGHAVSSQNVVLHQTHHHGHAAPIAHHIPVAHHSPAVSHHAPTVHQQSTQHSHGGHHEEHHEEHHAPAHYSFEYSVHDPHTGDIKSQHETREGDKTHGFYTFHEADGTIRRVDYTVDKHSGFNAVVHREGHATHHQPAHHSHH